MTEHADIYEALEAARKEFPPIVADSDNPFTKSRYASLAGVKDAVTDILRAHGVSIFPYVARDALITELRHRPSDTAVSCEYPLVVNDNPQQAASSLTYARRYSLTTLLDLVVDKDDDGNAASGRVAQSAERPERHNPPPIVEVDTPEGWDSAEQCREAHNGLARRIGKLADEHRESARDFRDREGWPVSVAKFSELEEVVRAAEKLS